MLEQYLEKWSNSINNVTIEGVKSAINIGGQSTLAFLKKEGKIPNKPVVAYEIWDIAPIDWTDELTLQFKKFWSNPLDWALYCKENLGAEILCLRLMGAHPDFNNKKPEELADLCKKISDKVGIPLIVVGCRDNTKDSLVMPACSQALKGKKSLLGSVTQENYKTLVASCIADGHNIIAESPIDINIAKQLNILISELGLSPGRIVIDPTIGALGYGLEYAYSIMERARLSALTGDSMLSMPFICFVGQESWRTKEAKTSKNDAPIWGDEKIRGILWETVTANAFLQSGADILVMRHPEAIKSINNIIKDFFK